MITMKDFTKGDQIELHLIQENRELKNTIKLLE
jgi:hypothetical protein